MHAVLVLITIVNAHDLPNLSRFDVLLDCKRRLGRNGPQALLRHLSIKSAKDFSNQSIPCPNRQTASGWAQPECIAKSLLLELADLELCNWFGSSDGTFYTNLWTGGANWEKHMAGGNQVAHAYREPRQSPPKVGRTLHQSSVPCKQFLGTDLASWKKMKQFACPSGEHRFEVPDTIPGSPPTVDISRLQAPSSHQTSSNIKLFLCQTVPLWPSAAPKSQRVYPDILRCQQYHEMLPSAHRSCTSALQ